MSDVVFLFFSFSYFYFAVPERWHIPFIHVLAVSAEEYLTCAAQYTAINLKRTGFVTARRRCSWIVA